MKKFRLLISIVFSLIMAMGVSFSSMATELNNGGIRLVIENYKVEGGFVSAGSEAEITFTVRNTNKMLKAQNVVLSFANSQGIVFPVEGNSNQIYIGNIGAGASSEVVLPVRIVESEVLPDNIHDITLQLTLTFFDANLSDRAEQISISIPLKQECEPNIVEIKLADGSCANENSIISTEIENSGSVNAENVDLHIILQDGQEFIYNIGEIGGGITKFYDHTICIPQSGVQNVTAYLSYNDEDDNYFMTDNVDYEIRVLEEGLNKLELQNGNVDNSYASYLLVNIVLAVIAVAIIFVFHKRDTRRINSGKEVGDGKRS